MSKTTRNLLLILLAFCSMLLLGSLVVQAQPSATHPLGITPTPTFTPAPTPSPTAIPTPNEIPEPGTLLLFGGGLAALALGAAKRKTKAP
ncbi:MAG: PEP-CTERM sorting domain-containing protein [Chloroflexota bacterium]